MTQPCGRSGGCPWRPARTTFILDVSQQCGDNPAWEWSPGPLSGASSCIAVSGWRQTKRASRTGLYHCSATSHGPRPEPCARGRDGPERLCREHGLLAGQARAGHSTGHGKSLPKLVAAWNGASRQPAPGPSCPTQNAVAHRGHPSQEVLHRNSGVSHYRKMPQRRQLVSCLAEERARLTSWLDASNPAFQLATAAVLGREQARLPSRSSACIKHPVPHCPTAKRLAERLAPEHPRTGSQLPPH